MNENNFIWKELFVAYFDPKIGSIMEWSYHPLEYLQTSFNSSSSSLLKPCSCSSRSHSSISSTALLKNLEYLILGHGFQKSIWNEICFYLPFISLSDSSPSTSNTMIMPKISNGLWGIAIFHLLSTDSSEERFSRMRCLGLLSTSLLESYHLIPILKYFVSLINESNGQGIESILDPLTSLMFTSEIFASELIHRFFQSFPNSFTQFQEKFPSYVSTLPIFTSARPSPYPSFTYSLLQINPSHLFLLSHFLLHPCRMLVYTSSNTALLTQFCLQLLHCIDYPFYTSKIDSHGTPLYPLLYRTSNYLFNSSNDYSILQLCDGSSPSWLVCTTDISLLENQIKISDQLPCLSWDVLVILSDPVDPQDTAHHLIGIRDQSFSTKFTALSVDSLTSLTKNICITVEYSSTCQQSPLRNSYFISTHLSNISTNLISTLPLPADILRNIATLPSFLAIPNSNLALLLNWWRIVSYILQSSHNYHRTLQDESISHSFTHPIHNYTLSIVNTSIANSQQPSNYQSVIVLSLEDLVDVLLPSSIIKSWRVPFATNPRPLYLRFLEGICRRYGWTSIPTLRHRSEKNGMWNWITSRLHGNRQIYPSTPS